MMITAQLSAVSGVPTTVPFTVGGTATGGGVDYTITASPIVIPAGSLMATISITVVNDAVAEPDETIIVTMGTPTNAVLGPTSTYTATIWDNDVSIASTLLAEGNSGTADMRFTVTRLGTGAPLSINYATHDQTALADADYLSTSGTVSFAPGQATATITVPVIGNMLSQPNRVLAITAWDPQDGSISFATGQTFATGASPYAVTVGDFNGDGLPDLALANYSSNTISVLLNTTPTGAITPSFAAQATFAVGSYPYSLAVGDFNGDGRPDLAVANSSGNTVSVLLNTTAPGAATASFAAQQTFATGTSPRSVAAGDFNGDGKLDLAVANYSSNTVSVLLNTTALGAPSASFAAHKAFTTGSGPTSVAVADVNTDGRADLAVANVGSYTVSVLLNTTAAGAATASFAAQQAFTVGISPNCVATGDVDGDGRPDIAVANYGANTISVLMNTTATGAASATFAAQATFATGSGPRAVSLADVNGDGRPDLAVANATSNTVSVLLNTMPAGSSTPAFAAQYTLATGSAPRSVATADYNADGRPDMALGNSGASTVTVLLNTYGASAFGTIVDDDVTPTPASYYARQDTAHANIEMSLTPDFTGAAILTQPLATLRAIRIPGSSGEDTLTLDFTNGNPIPSTGLTFDAGDGSDELILKNLTAGDDLSVGPSQVLFGTTPISLTDVEKIQLGVPGSDLVLGSLTLNADAELPPGAGIALRTSSLAIADGATLDLADNVLIVDCADQPAAESALATINAKITAARNDSAGLWQGKGLTSSAARDDLSAIHGLAAIINNEAGVKLVNQVGSQHPGLYSVIVKYALNGDSDLNGRLDADDYFRMDVAYRLQSDGNHSGYRNGDIDYQSGISADNFYLIDQAFIRQPAPPAAGATSAARSDAANLLAEQFPTTDILS